MYGPPGTGKTLMARQIGKMLNATEPKVVSGPEILNKFVGESEENVRKLFGDAEAEYAERGDESSLVSSRGVIRVGTLLLLTKLIAHYHLR